MIKVKDMSNGKVFVVYIFLAQYVYWRKSSRRWVTKTHLELKFCWACIVIYPY